MSILGDHFRPIDVEKVGVHFGFRIIWGSFCRSFSKIKMVSLFGKDLVGNCTGQVTKG